MADEERKELKGWTFLGELTPEEQGRVTELAQKDREMTFKIGERMREVIRLSITAEQVTAQSRQLINGAVQRYDYQGMVQLINGKELYKPSNTEDAMLVMGASPTTPPNLEVVKETPEEEEQEDA